MDGQTTDDRTEILLSTINVYKEKIYMFGTDALKVISFVFILHYRFNATQVNIDITICTQ